MKLKLKPEEPVFVLPKAELVVDEPRLPNNEVPVWVLPDEPRLPNSEVPVWLVDVFVEELDEVLLEENVGLTSGKFIGWLKSDI